MSALHPRCSAPAEQHVGQSAHTRGAPALPGLRPEPAGSGRAPPASLLCTSRAAYGAKRPHTWGSCPDRALTCGERRPALPPAVWRLPMNVRGEAPTPEERSPGPGFARWVVAECPPPLSCSAPAKQHIGRNTHPSGTPAQAGLRPAGSICTPSRPLLGTNRATYRPGRPPAWHSRLGAAACPPVPCLAQTKQSIGQGTHKPGAPVLSGLVLRGLRWEAAASPPFRCSAPAESRAPPYARLLPGPGPARRGAAARPPLHCSAPAELPRG